MGAETSMHGDMRIVLEKYVFYPGEQVRGVIHVILKQKIPPSKFYLRFKGTELVGSGKTTNDYSEIGILKYPVSKTEYLLMSWDVPLEPNQFSIPFTLVLPQIIPGSFSYIVPGNLLKMMYRISAHLKADGVKIQSKQELWIMHQFHLEGGHEDQVTAKIVSWCFKKQGTISMKMRWINDKYTSKTPLECIVEIDNTRSKSTVKGITMKVYCIVQRAVRINNPHRSIIRMPMCRSTINLRIPPGEKIEGENAQRILISFNGFPRIPEFLPNMRTYQGKLFTCNFFIDFGLDLDTYCLCCGDWPGISKVYFVESEGNFTGPTVDAPSDWNPRVLSSVDMVYDQHLEKQGTHFNLNRKDELANLDQTRF